MPDHSLLPGNPGPRAGYNAHDEPAVVPYFNIIE